MSETLYEKSMERIPQWEPLIEPGDVKAVHHTLMRGWIQEGPTARQFEEEFAKYVGSRYAVTCTSGTAALFMALKALDIRGRVAIPTITAVGTANAVWMAGCEPVLCDADGNHGLISSKRIKGVSAVIPVHLNGREAKFDADYIPTIEDAAQALGSQGTDGKQLGIKAPIGCFSLATSKIITTGQGGMCVTDDKDLYLRMVEIKDQGTTARLDSQSIPDYYPKRGFNFKMTDMQAALGLAQLRTLPDRISKRRYIQRLYKEQLHGVRNVEFVDHQDLHWYHDIQLPPAMRDKVYEFLKSRYIDTRAYYTPLHRQPAYKTSNGGYAMADLVSACGLYLPSSLRLKESQILRVCNEVKEAIKRT